MVDNINNLGGSGHTVEPAQSGYTGDDSINISNEGDYDVQTMHQLSLEEGDDDLDSEYNITDEADKVVSGEQDEDDTPDLDDAFGDEEDSDTSDSQSTSSDEDLFTFTLDGKKFTAPKNAEVEITIDGKKEKMPLQEALDNASGNINISRENSRIGRERKALETERNEFNQERETVAGHAEALLQLSDDPYELCEYIADLKGGNAEEIFNDLVGKTVKILEEYASMTPKERQMAAENRKLKREAKAREAKDSVATTRTENEQKIQKLTSSLEDNGFTMDDWNKAVADLEEGIKNQEITDEDLGIDEGDDLTEDVIINYMVKKDIADRVDVGLSELAPKLKEDTEFVSRIKRAITKAEALAGKMTQVEVTQLCKAALEKDNKALGESLSKKVDSKKKRKTGSETADSHEQEDDDDEDFEPVTIEEYLNQGR